MISENELRAMSTRAAEEEEEYTDSDSGNNEVYGSNNSNEGEYSRDAGEAKNDAAEIHIISDDGEGSSEKSGVDAETGGMGGRPRYRHQRRKGEEARVVTAQRQTGRKKEQRKR